MLYVLKVVGAVLQSLGGGILTPGVGASNTPSAAVMDLFFISNIFRILGYLKGLTGMDFPINRIRCPQVVKQKAPVM